jgi:hypothetical protein
MTDTRGGGKEMSRRVGPRMTKTKLGKLRLSGGTSFDVSMQKKEISMRSPERYDARCAYGLYELFTSYMSRNGRLGYYSWRTATFKGPGVDRGVPTVGAQC